MNITVPVPTFSRQVRVPIPSLSRKQLAFMGGAAAAAEGAAATCA